MSTQPNFPVLLKVNIVETNSSYKIEADIRGFHSEQVSISCWDDSLIIEMTASNYPMQSYYLGEPEIDNYRRIIPVGFYLTPDQIKSQYNNGTLLISIRKPLGKPAARQHSESIMA